MLRFKVFPNFKATFEKRKTLVEMATFVGGVRVAKMENIIFHDKRVREKTFVERTPASTGSRVAT